MKKIQSPCIKLKQHLNREDYDMISALQAKCNEHEDISLKLELDYKLAAALESSDNTSIKEVNEFMYFHEQQLIGYIGICSFGGGGTPLEIMGMVHPEYRRQGVFSMLNEFVLAECKRRKAGSILILCDNKSYPGHRFVEKTGAVHSHSEFELYLQQNYSKPDEKQLCGIILRKAVNSDAYEIARQNAIYFGDCVPSEELDIGDNSKDDILLPEEEEKRGITIYLAQKDSQIVGKVHLDTNTSIGGIYGLGVLPEYRGKGFGRAILLSAINQLKEENKKDVMLQVAAENATALNLYKSCGFNETSTMDYFRLKL